MQLSIIILAKNEAELIRQCISSAKLLHPSEIIVIDDNSTDDTAVIAKSLGAQVIIHTKKDFAEVRNFALQKAGGEWIFYIDADEVVSDDLVQEVKSVLSQNVDVIAYTITRHNYYLGKAWPKNEKILRLFKKDHLDKWFGELHETASVKGSAGKLHAPLYHYTHRNLSEMVANTVIWSDIEAKLRFDAKHPPVSWWVMPRVMLPTFIDYYFKQGGWKIGTVGLIESIYQAFSIFITYAKLWELQQSKPK